LTYLGFAVLLNFALAHYREVAGSLTEEAARDVITRIFSDPLVLDIKSWLFFLIGFAFSAVAFGDGVFFADPYPGYGEIEQRLKAAHIRYSERKSELIGHLAQIRDEASEIFQESRRDLSVRRSEHDAILESRARMVSLFNEHQMQLERAANSLLAKYHEANQRARSTPAPTRFSKAYALARHKTDKELLKTSAREDLRCSITASQELLERQVVAIQEEFERAVASYRQIDDLVPETADAPPQLQAA
jgi:hypothetical protein